MSQPKVSLDSKDPHYIWLLDKCVTLTYPLAFSIYIKAQYLGDFFMKFLFISSMLLSAVGITLQRMLCLDWLWHFLLFFFYTLHNKSRLWRHLILENRIWFETSFLFLERGHSILVSNITHSKSISLTKVHSELQRESRRRSNFNLKVIPGLTWIPEKCEKGLAF